MNNNGTIKPPPKGLAILALVGPAFVWCAEYIGSGEVILATRMGAIFGYTVLWAIIIGIVLKAFIGIGGGRYTVCTGEAMMDMFSRMPGRGNWAVWIVLIVELIAGAISIGAVASAAGIFVNSLIPLRPFVWGWIITAFAIFSVWSGDFKIIKYIMSTLVFIIIIGVTYVTFYTFPGITPLLKGVFGFSIPEIPTWAQGLEAVSDNSWNEILPLIGWAAGGFASQVWYTYWVLGAGYGMAQGRGYGESANLASLKTMTVETARKVKGWCRVLVVDGSIAMLIGITATCCFLLAGSGVLRPLQLAPNGPELAFELSNVFSRLWGSLGGTLYIVVGAAALISTQIGQFGGWPRLLADATRICFPGFAKRFSWRTQFRIFLGFFFVTNMLIVYTLGIQPVSLIKISAVVEGLILTPLQATLVIIGLAWVMPKLLSREAWAILKPNWFLYLGLTAAVVVFSYFCLFQLFRG